MQGVPRTPNVHAENRRTPGVTADYVRDSHTSAEASESPVFLEQDTPPADRTPTCEAESTPHNHAVASSFGSVTAAETRTACADVTPIILPRAHRARCAAIAALLAVRL